MSRTTEGSVSPTGFGRADTPLCDAPDFVATGPIPLPRAVCGATLPPNKGRLTTNRFYNILITDTFPQCLASCTTSPGLRPSKGKAWLQGDAWLLQEGIKRWQEPHFCAHCNSLRANTPRHQRRESQLRRCARGQPGTTGIIVGYTGGNVGASFQPNGPYSNSSDPLVQQYTRAFLKQLEEVWPGATAEYNGTAMLSHPGSDPNLLGSYSCWLVGQYTLFSGYEKARQGKQDMKIHFAGEHCSTNFQGFMEGGAQEGARAANEILGDYKNGIFP